MTAVNAWLPILAFILSATLVAMMVGYARRKGVMDIPNSRSSHSVPTPRGGGAGLILAIAIAGSSELARTYFDYGPRALALGVGLLCLCVIGWVDDHRGLSVRVRLGVQVVSALTVGLFVVRLSPEGGWVYVASFVLWSAWALTAINIVNFMDGIDGIVGLQAAVFGGYIWQLSFPGSIASRLALLLACASAGFLIWNWQPARIFLGDVGSGPLGFLFVVMGAIAVAEGIPLLLVFVPLFPLFFDAAATLARRAANGERLASAHRSHLYQRLANAGIGHAPVSALYALLGVAGGVIGLSIQRGSLPLAAGLAMYVVAVISGWYLLDRRFPLAEGQRPKASENGSALIRNRKSGSFEEREP